MSNSSPDKPRSVPADAYWSEDEDEWILAQRNPDGEFHGLVKYYRRAGTLCCATEFVDGTAHGKFTRYHENGEVSRTGAFEDGTLQGTNAFYRSSEETTENFPSGLGDQIWRCEMDYRDGDIVEGRLYDREGQRVLESGEPFPEQRPAGVPEEAHFRSIDGEYRWVAGASRVEDGQPVRLGTWRFWSPSGQLIEEHRYEDGVRQYDRPAGVPAAAQFDSDDEVWLLDPRDERGRTHGDRYVWMANGLLYRHDTFAHGDITCMREHLDDGSLGQESHFIAGGVPQRKWFRRTDEETLNSFPNVLDDHPEAYEVEYLFDEHGRMTGFCISGEGGRVLEREEVYRNAGGDTEQAKFPSIEAASAAWIAEGDRYTGELNGWLAELYSGEEPSAEEPGFDRHDLERAVIESVVELNRRGQSGRARELFPLYYDGIGKAFWDNYGLVIDRVLHAGDAIYARVLHGGEEPYVVRTYAGSTERVEGVIGFGSSHDKRYLAFAYDDRIEVTGSGSTRTYAYPRAYQFPAADALDTPALGSGLDMGLREIRVLPGGEEILLVSAEGIYLIGAGPAQPRRLFPLDAAMAEYVDQYGGDPTFSLEMRYVNADVAPAGNWLTCGAMFANGVSDGLAIYQRGAQGFELKATSQADSFFPMQAVFHRERPHIAFAACMYASLHNDLVNTTFRIDLDDITGGEIEEFGGGIARERGVVSTIASFGQGFLLGFNNGYIRWMGVNENLELLGYLFVGGSVRHIDVSPDGRGFAVVTESGTVSSFRLGEGASRNLIATMPVTDVARTALFKTFPPLQW